MDAPFLVTAPEVRRRDSQGQARSAPPLDSNLQNPAAPRQGRREHCAPGCVRSPRPLSHAYLLQSVCRSVARADPFWVVLPAPLPGRLDAFMASPGAARFALAPGYRPFCTSGAAIASAILSGAEDGIPVSDIRFWARHNNAGYWVIDSESFGHSAILGHSVTEFIVALVRCFSQRA